MKNLIKYREMDQKSLQAQLVDFENEYFDLKFKLSLGKLENTSLVAKKRKEIAQIKTIMSEKKLSQVVKGSK